MYTQNQQAWLEDPSAIRIVLAKAQVSKYNITTLTWENTYLYLSTDNYITTDGSVSFVPLIKSNITLNETLSIDGSGAMTFGDIEIANPNGDLDEYFDQTKYIWSNKPIKIYYGDARWICANLAEIEATFLLIFNGIIDDADSRNRISFNIKIRDKLERLNTSLTEDKLGVYGSWPGGQQNTDAIKPLVFGEVFNVSPMLIDPNKTKYMFNNGSSEKLIEIRGNAVPFKFASVTGITLNTVVSNTGTVTSATIATGGTNFMIGDQVSIIDINSTPKAIFTASTSSNIITVGIVSSGVISVGMGITGIGVPTNTVITAGSGITFTASNSISTATNITIVGVNTPAIFTISQVDGSTSTSAIGAATLGSIAVPGTGYLTSNLKKTGLYGISIHRKIAAFDNTAGIFCLATNPIGTITCSVQGIKNSIDLSTGSLVIDTYNNNIANLVALIVTQYGKTSSRFTSTDLDLTNLAAFSTSNTQSVGIQVNDITNVLVVCKQLVNSIGGQIFITKEGKLQILRYGIGETTGRNITTITENDILYNSLSISNRPGVLGAIKLGYAKNWTVQTGLVSPIPQAHKDMLASEWLSLTVLDQAIINKYLLSQDTQQVDTYLITTNNAQIEAERRLAFYKSQHIIYKFKGTSKLLSLQLGQEIILVHSRFNLYNSGNGQVGQIISLSPNWTTGYIDVEVLI